MGLRGDASGKESACQWRRCKRCGFDPGWEDPLEEEMATHSSMLSWKIPWAEEPGGLYGVGVAEEPDTTEHTHTHSHRLWIHIPICLYPRASSGPEGMMPSPLGPLFSSRPSRSSDSLANRRLMQGEEQMKKMRSAHSRKQLHGNRIQGNSSQAASGAGLS